MTAHARFVLPRAPFPPSHLRQVEDLQGPAGRLEAVLNTGAAEAPFVGVVCHPYPPAGGTLHNKVVYHAMKALTGMGLPVLRFNFRGVGLSEGTFDHGYGEQGDVRAAVDWVASHLGLPVLLAGFSFGSYVGLRATCDDQRVIGRIGLGLPVRAAGRDYTYEFLAGCPAPLLFVSGDQDEFSPTDELVRVAGTSPQPHRLVIVEGAEHFFQGVPGSPQPKLTLVQQTIEQWLLDELATNDATA